MHFSKADPVFMGRMVPHVEQKFVSLMNMLMLIRRPAVECHKDMAPTQNHTKSLLLMIHNSGDFRVNLHTD